MIVQPSLDTKMSNEIYKIYDIKKLNALFPSSI